MTPFELALRDIHDINGSMQQSVQLQAMQNGLLANMSETMRSIHEEIAQVRMQQAQALAIQQELLTRERMQAYLEEFIYQTQKLVIECSHANTQIEPSTRYFLLHTVLTHIGNEGIATPIIRGRDNKAAFDKVVSEATAMRHVLRNQPAVKAAIAWANHLQDELDEERRREAEELEDERRRKAERKRKQMERERMEMEEEEERERKERLEAQTMRTYVTLSVVAAVLVLFVAGCFGCCLIGQLGQRRADAEPRLARPYAEFATRVLQDDSQRCRMQIQG